MRSCGGNSHSQGMRWGPGKVKCEVCRQGGLEVACEIEAVGDECDIVKRYLGTRTELKLKIAQCNSCSCLYCTIHVSEKTYAGPCARGNSSTTVYWTREIEERLGLMCIFNASTPLSRLPFSSWLSSEPKLR